MDYALILRDMVEKDGMHREYEHWDEANDVVRVYG